ncbi:MAG: hypothetical protein ACI4HO_09960 [Ruminococcus sp.]
MLTALTIESLPKENWYKNIFNKIRGNSVKTQVKSARGVALRHITYINRTGKIDWFKLDSIIGSQRNHLLCSEDIILPTELGFKRFDNKEFKIRLSANFGIYVLSKLGEKADLIKTGFFDPKGECTEILGGLLKYSSNVVVVSDNLTAFHNETRRITDETGATVQISSNRIQLMDCDLVIAPMQITELLPLSGNCIVLSGATPTVCVPGLVYHSYYFRMPNKFDSLKPKELSEEYFAGALYTKARQYELGSIVPTVCRNYSSTQTRVSICKYLEKSAESRTTK